MLHHAEQPSPQEDITAGHYTMLRCRTNQEFQPPEVADSPLVFIIVYGGNGLLQLEREEGILAPSRRRRLLQLFLLLLSVHSLGPCTSPLKSR